MQSLKVIKNREEQISVTEDQHKKSITPAKEVKED